MISRWFPLTLFAFVFAPGLLHAQQPFPNAPQGSVERTFVIDVSAAQNEKMYEDIEIMRRILGRNLQSLYLRVSTTNVIPNPFTSTYSPPKPANIPGLFGLEYPASLQSPYVLLGDPQTYILASPPYKEEVFSSLEGVYLKGQGVVYTATLSSLQPRAKTEAGNSEKVVYDIVLRESEWDSIRRQVRKEKDEPKKPTENKPPLLSDVLLKVLAENGHHFSQLGENESLTIVLTVHEESPSSSAAKSGTGSTKADTRSSDRHALLKETGDLALLGSMHLKQAKYPDAIAVYQKMLSLAKSPNQEADVRRMLAMCYAGMGDNEKARAELDKAIDILKKGKESKENPTAAKPAAALPLKLIISTPKKLLDQVKEGKTTFEDFRRQASVETLRFGVRR